MVEVLVEYDYEAKEPDELTIQKGDIIKDVVKKSDGWWEGVLNDKKGMFPDNFVKVIEKDVAVVLRNKKDVNRIRKCRVIFSYNQDHEDELNLKVGDVIDIVGEEEEGWWRGLLNGKEGVFPSNFVEEIHPTISKSKSSSREDLTEIINDKAPNLPAKPVKQLCEVKYPYKALNEDELTLKQGDIVTIINKDGQDPGWWKGELNGKIGVFPDNFVVILSSNPEDKLNRREETKSLIEPVAIKPISVATQRKSLEVKSDSKTSNSSEKTPPIPGKKPIISLKKSPSGSSTGSGLFAEIRKKIVDVVDGATSSKTKTEVNNDVTKDNNNSENVFDQVERRPLLHDVRATRAKAPGRRLPSAHFKDEDDILGIAINGTSFEQAEKHTEMTSSTESDLSTSTTSSKPKLREWEKHKAPWLEEMKQNQAKRTSTSPGPENKLKLTPTDVEESKSTKVSPATERESTPPMDMSKSMSSLNTSLKTPPNELEKIPAVRTKPALPTTTKPSPTNNLVKEISSQKPKGKLPTPAAKPATIPSTNTQSTTCDHSDMVSVKQYTELLERIVKLEKQNETHQMEIQELKDKLQLETDMRILMQVELEKVSHCVLQV